MARCRSCVAWVGGAVIALVAFAASVLLPMADVARPSTSELLAQSRLYELARGLVGYAQGNGGVPPDVEFWAQTLVSAKLASIDALDSHRIVSEPNAAIGSDLVYMPLVNADGTLAPLTAYPNPGMGWIIRRENETRVPEKVRFITCVTLDGEVPTTLPIPRETLARLLESQEKLQRERSARTEAR